MATQKEIFLTLDGLVKLEKELDLLKTVRRREVAERIKQALEFGDLSENSEYEDAKNEQGFIESRILQIENILRNARVLDIGEVRTDTVSLGTKVLLEDVETGEEIEYTIVGSAEADPDAARISDESPVGRALMGQTVGAVVTVQVPMGSLKYKIKDIKKMA
ncbi:MAG: transcription elongation factor GreA [Firmicutes bacterium]|nr:transcription elongation factor GreA [Bacillota bacterium]